jgi:hypothetical protein
MTDDLQRFCENYKHLQEHTNEARLEPIEQQIQVIIQVDAGKTTLSGYVQETGFGPGVRSERIDTDPTFINDALDQVTAVIAAFPIRGAIPRATPRTH